MAKGGDEVRNGGGLAEQYLAFALENLSVSIDLCLAKESCGKSSEGRAILKQIKENLPQELKANIIKFESESKNPGFFVIDGVVKMAITGNKVGDPVYYNLDLLYQDNELRMSFGQATQSLIHELAHHLGHHDHNFLELLGAEVRSFIEGNVNDVPFLPHLQSSGFSAVGTEIRSFFDSGSLLLLFSDKIIDLSNHFYPLLMNCDKVFGEIDPLASSAVQFFNLHWEHNFEGASLKGERTLAGNVILYCKHKHRKEYRKVYKFEIGVTSNYSNKFFYIRHRMKLDPYYLFTLTNMIH